jgi:hypothetical protein
MSLHSYPSSTFALFLVQYIAEQTITGRVYFDEVQFSRRSITPAHETL